ncbi:MAG: hypothetical protein U0526_03125 [Candidatus Saccharibacteria bacterium]
MDESKPQPPLGPPYSMAGRRRSEHLTAHPTSDQEVATLRAIMIGSILLTGAFIPIWIWRRIQRNRRATP